MKISEFEVGLAALGGLDTVTRFLTACRPSASKTVAAFSKGIAPALRDKQLDRSPSRSVDEILQDLHRALGRATDLKATAFANDCKALLSALEGYSPCDCDLIAQEIAAGPLPKPKKTPA